MEIRCGCFCVCVQLGDLNGIACYGGALDNAHETENAPSSVRIERPLSMQVPYDDDKCGKKGLA